MKPLKIIDNFLNSITMYSLMVYGLSSLLLGAVIFSLIGSLPLSALGIILSVVIVVVICLIADRLLSTIWNAPSNKYSSLITSLILCLILPPSTSLHHLALLAIAALIAIASKYILVIRYKHLFNPAATAALILGLTSLLPATWWVGSPVMLPLTVIFGLLVLRKIRRFTLFFSFLIAALIVTTLVGFHHDLSISYILQTAFKSSPLIFLGTVMLTEPTTMPPRRWQQMIYGLLVGGLFMSQLRLGSIVTATPEAALIIGNVYAYLVSPKYKLRLKLSRRLKLSPQIYEFSFSGANNFNFRPGQYLEWTLPQNHTDRRGNRRIFSIASAPGENELRMLTKLSEPGSSYKKDLLGLVAGQEIVASQLTGDFVLPKELSQKLVLIAGGIGVSPFISMIRDMIKNNQKRDIVLVYLITDPADFCYTDLWNQAKALGVRVVPIASKPSVSWKGKTGYLTDKILKDLAPDYKARRYYLSGPPGLVDNYKKLLTNMNISRGKIITDHFSGY